MSRNQQQKLLLSKSEAAKLLGISRNATLGELIATGHLRTVTLGGRERIPYAEIERLAREGVAPRAARKRRDRAPSPPTGDVEAAIRAIKL